MITITLPEWVVWTALAIINLFLISSLLSTYSMFLQTKIDRLKQINESYDAGYNYCKNNPTPTYDKRSSNE